MNSTHVGESAECKGVLWADKVSKIVSLPLAEKDILFLQDVFLKNGIYNLKFADFGNARQVTTSILKSLAWHKNIAYIAEDSFWEGAYNITDFAENNDLQDLFLDNFYFDFLYIEKSITVTNALWFKKFYAYLKSYNFDKALPIIQAEAR